MCATDKCAIFETKDIFPLKEIEFKSLKLSAPNNPLEHLAQANEYGEYGAVMNFPTSKDSGFYHTQQEYMECSEFYENIYNELSQIVDEYKTK